MYLVEKEYCIVFGEGKSFLGFFFDIRCEVLVFLYLFFIGKFIFFEDDNGNFRNVVLIVKKYFI